MRKKVAGLILASAIALAGMSQVSPALASENEDASGVTVDTATQTVTMDSTEVGIQLPGETVFKSVDVGQVPDELFNGTSAALVSTQAGQSVISSYATDAGVQTLIEIPNADAPAEYRFPLNLPAGGEAVLLDDGSVLILDTAGNPAGGFRAPWAIDANGQNIPTSFRIDGGDLVQTISFGADTVFPVIADPDLGVEWWGNWVRLTKNETRSAANIIANNQGPASLAGLVCGALPGPAAIGCGTAVVLAYFKFVDPINRASSAGKCAAINFPWVALNTPQIGWTSINVTTVNCTR